MKFSRKKNSHIPVEVQLAPLIDTLLVLLVVFMVATPFVHNAFKVSLPTGNNQEYKDSKNDYVIAIDQYGRLYTKGFTQMKKQDILNEIYKHYSSYPGLSVIFFVDKDALCGTVAELMSDIREIGVKNVYFKTKKIPCA